MARLKAHYEQEGHNLEDMNDPIAGLMKDFKSH